MRCCLHLLFALTASAAQLPPCLYTISTPIKIKGVEQKLDTLHLDTSVINMFMDQVRDFDPSVNMRTYPIVIEGVCNIGPKWDYRLYQAPEDSYITVAETIINKDPGELTQKQDLFLTDKEYSHLKIVIEHWQIGKTTLDTVFLSKDPANNMVYIIDGSEKVFKGLSIQLSGQIPEEYRALGATEPPKTGSGFRFPEHYECLFSSEAKDIDYFIKSSGQSCFVQSEYELGVEAWQTLGLPEQSVQSFFLDSSTPHEERQFIGEKRLYVKTDQQAMTLVYWNQNNSKYWMSAISKPQALIKQANMSGLTIVSNPGPIQPRIPAKARSKFRKYINRWG